MSQLNRILGGVAILVFTLFAPAWASKLILKDGTTLEGTVIPNGDEYWVKLSDGTTKTVAASEVQQMIADAPAGQTAPGTTDISETGAFRNARLRASSATSALAAVAIWQEFIDKYPDSTNIADAKTELAHWQDLAGTGAEKINGKWVGGRTNASRSSPRRMTSPARESK